MHILKKENAVSLVIFEKTDFLNKGILKIKGKIFSETLNPENKSIFVAQEQLVNGVYMCKIVQNGTTIAIEKMVIIK